MRALVMTLVALAGSVGFAGTANAQAFSRLQAGQQMVTLESGLKAGLATSLGYAAGLRLHALDRTVMPFVQATLFTARPDWGDYGGRAGAQMSLLRLGWFDLSTQLALGVEGTRNSVHRATALRTDVVLLAGHYARSWFLVAEGGYDHAWATYLKSTDYYRTSIYPGAKDGWYGNTAGTLHLGLKTGFRVGPVEALLRVGSNRTEQLNELNLPFYAMLGTNYRF
jgi:hypothetical protein